MNDNILHKNLIRLAVFVLSLTVFTMWLNRVNAQTIYLTDNPYNADFVCYVTTNRFVADWTIYVTDNKYEAKEGRWFITDNRWEADHIVYMTSNKFLSDYTIFHTRNKYLTNFDLNK